MKLSTTVGILYLACALGEAWRTRPSRHTAIPGREAIGAILLTAVFVLQTLNHHDPMHDLVLNLAAVGVMAGVAVVRLLRLREAKHVATAITTTPGE